MQSDFIVWFDEYQDSDHPRVGGKNASLGTMIAAGLPVPPGFALTTDAYAHLRSQEETNDAVNRLLGEVDHDDPVGLAEISIRIRALIEAVPLDPEVNGSIRDGYEELCERCGAHDVAVAVRSSATAEDLPDASFAGQQDTYLWIRGGDSVVANVQRCWSSLFTDRAISYRRRMGHDHQANSMSVGIQEMVNPKAAGVAFTLNPSDGDRSTIAIEASWGFGEAVVSGEVTPDNYLVDKVVLEITKRTVSRKSIEYALNGADTLEKLEVPPDRQLSPCLTDDEILAVAAMAKQAEQHYGVPQDIEWAIDPDRSDPDPVVLLQARPETVWSRTPRRQVADPNRGFMDGIVSTLLAPVHTRHRSGDRKGTSRD